MTTESYWYYNNEVSKTTLQVTILSIKANSCSSVYTSRGVVHIALFNLLANSWKLLSCKTPRRVVHVAGCFPFPSSQCCNIARQQASTPFAPSSAWIWFSVAPVWSKSRRVPMSFHLGEMIFMISILSPLVAFSSCRCARRIGGATKVNEWCVFVRIRVEDRS